MRDNPEYPGLGRWYQEMDKLPAYQKVKSDDKTLQMLIRYSCLPFSHMYTASPAYATCQHSPHIAHCKLPSVARRRYDTLHKVNPLPAVKSSIRGYVFRWSFRSWQCPELVHFALCRWKARKCMAESIIGCNAGSSLGWVTGMCRKLTSTPRPPGWRLPQSWA